MKTYHANVKRDGRYWFIYVPEVERATQARHLREVELMARDLVAVMEDVDPDSFELVVNLTLPEDARTHVEAAARLRAEAATANTEATQEARAAARSLTAAGLPVRDVGIALGVSHQRVSQLLKA